MHRFRRPDGCGRPVLRRRAGWGSVVRAPEVPHACSPAPYEDLVVLASAARSGGPDVPRPLLTRRTFLGAAALTAATLAGCARGSGDARADAPLHLGAIPDQDPEVLARQFGTVSDALATELGLPVAYVPVTDYAAAVSLFRTGDLDLVWFGGLTGVQARLQTPGAMPIAQRDIDREFRSVFVVNAATGLAPSDDLRPLRDLRFTYGSETSTSGRLMPAYFLREAGVDPEGFSGGPGFSGSHDATIELVASGSYQAGVLNAQVWDARSATGEVDPLVVEYGRTPPYADYHWLLGRGAVDRLGSDLPERVRAFFTGLSPDALPGREVLELFGAAAFVPARASDYDRIERIGRELGLVR